jgi:hypothetical protein
LRNGFGAPLHVWLVLNDQVDDWLVIAAANLKHGMDTLLVQPNIFTVVEQHHPEHRCLYLLEYAELLREVLTDTLLHERRLKQWGPLKLLMHELTNHSDTVTNIGLHLEGRASLEPTSKYGRNLVDESGVKLHEKKLHVRTKETPQHLVYLQLHFGVLLKLGHIE